MKYSIDQISSILGSNTSNEVLIDYEVRSVAFDSRKIIFAKKALFFALKGPKNNGHNYVQDAYDKGVRNFVITQSVEEQKDANYLLVDNSLVALQTLATYHRAKFDLEVMAITGSYGKTIVKDWLYEMLKGEKAVVKSPKSYNSQIGVALSLLQIQKHHDIAIIEAGISKVGEMDVLQKMIQPTLGIFTNLGEAHASGFMSKEEKLKEKLRLFKECKDVVTHSAYANVIKNNLPKTTIFTSTSQYDLGLKDISSISNASLCGAVLQKIGIDQITIEQKIASLSPISMRLEIMRGSDNTTIINDAYIADVPSLEIALNLLKQQSNGQSKIVILSDFEIEKNEQEKTYQKVAKLLSAFDIQKILLLGNQLIPYLKNNEVLAFNSKSELKTYLSANPLKNASILIKGSRKAQLEELADFLTIQIHDTVLETNLSALSHNIKSYSAYLKEPTKIIGVIKAGAYGSGSIEIAKTLLQNGVHYLAVAFTDEAIELRKAQITAPIIILNSQLAAQQSWLDYDLQPIIFSESQLNSLIALTERQKTTLKIHINLNTGMNRLGIEPARFEKIVEEIKGSSLEMESVFTHLSSSEDPSDDQYSHEQFALFDRTTKFLDGIVMRHVLNTTGILRFPEYQLDAIRLGLGLYGINLTNIEIDLIKVHSLKSKIIQIKEHEEGQSIGYNRKHRVEKGKRIATIPIGYADGLPRIAGNKRYEVVINGQKAKIIGNVCMDLIMTDVSAIPNANEGNEVIIFDQNHPIEQLAASCNTIPYEILSNISGRVKRIFVYE